MSAQHCCKIASESPKALCLQFLSGKRGLAQHGVLAVPGRFNGAFQFSPWSTRWNFLVKLFWDKSVLNCNCHLLFKNTHFSEVYKSSGWTSTKPNFAPQPLCFSDLNYHRLPSLYTSDIYEIYGQCVVCLLAGAQHYSHHRYHCL